MGNRRIHGSWVAIAAALVFLAACPKKQAEDATCKGDADCPEGLRCVNQQCLTCAEDSHCPDGQICQDGACVADPGPACTTDDECPDGQACVDGACKACTSNDECGPGGKCNAGECERAKACTEDTDCADDEDCIDGHCQKPWESDPPDVACALSTVYFDFDQSAIREDAREVLAANAACIGQAPADRVVSLEGHTDEEGTEEYNIALSERRARTVADYLARLGIDPARFQVIAKGEGEPSGAGETQDRRVELQWQ